jgi:hypothetical protein
MSTITAFVRVLVACFIGLAVTLVPLCLLLAVIGLAWIPGACLTEIHKTIVSPLGFYFVISETDCDLLAKDAAVTVFASRTGRKERTPLFKYDPAELDSSPAITAIDQNTILISIPRVSSIFFRKYEWDGVSIRYNIDTIDYPALPQNRNQEKAP